jgi:hypothetical protein
MPFPVNGTKYEVGLGLHPMWSADSRHVFVPRTQGTMEVIAIDARPAFRFAEAVATKVPAIGATGPEALRAYDVGRNGSMVGVITAGNLEALGDNRQIRVVLHWQDELNRLVPAR